MEELKVCLVQFEIAWEQKEKNFAQLETYFSKIEDADLIVLPEMFATGFSMNSKLLGETMQGDTVKWMQKHAIAKQAAIAGSLIIKEKGSFYNRLVFVKPDGTHYFYDKRHLFSLAGEEKHFKAGVNRVIVNYKDWRINLMVCYDLRFPVWSRNTDDYDIALYVANWPEKRRFAWSSLLVARAIENQCYVLGVNGVGKDGNGFDYSGNSIALDPLGETIQDLPIKESGVVQATLSKSKLNNVRGKFQFLEDRDNFEITL